MKKIIYLLLASLLSLPIMVEGQNTDAQLTTQANVIRNETSPGGNTKGRIADMFQGLINSKQSRIEPLLTSGTDTYTISPGAYDVSDITREVHWIQVGNANTGASTLNAQSHGARPLVRNDGAALEAGDLVANGVYIVAYDGANYKVLNLGTASGGGGDIPTLEEVLDESNDAGLNIITNLADPSGSTDAVTLGYMINSIDAAKNEITLGSVLSFDNDGGGLLVKDIGDPVDPQDAATKSYVDAAVGGGGAVTSVFSRSGVVTAQSGDYTAAQITNTPTGTIAGTTAQSAIDELDSEKVPNSRTISTTSPLSGGGDLSANRTLTIADAAADGTTKGAASFTANDFNASSGNISIDYTNGQAASGSTKGFLTSADYTTFNNKQTALSGTGLVSFSGTTPSYNTTSSSIAGILSDEVGTGLVVFSERPSRTVTGTSDTPTLSDRGGQIVFTNAGSVTFTLPTNASVAYPVGTEIWLKGISSGVVNVVAPSGGSVSSTSGNLLSPSTAGTDFSMVVKKTATNTWTLDNGTNSSGAAFTRTNGTYITTTLSGSMSGALNTAVDITVDLTGVVPLSLGGTGVSSTTQTYTPTLTNSANLSASTARQCTYMRVGNTVTVSGQLDIDPTTTSTLTTLGISLPVASNFTTAFQAGGTANAIGVADAGAGIQSDATNDRATLQYVCTDVSNHTMTFTFTYQVL